MDKSCHSTGDSSTSTNSASTNTNSSSSRDQYLKHLNKISHKISKPNPLLRKPTFDPQPPVAVVVPPPSQSQSQNLPQQHQPPVYNINKSDFRDVVQKLTGSPAHERLPAPPAPIQPPRPSSSSRLHRIRPPPLAQLGSRPPPVLNDVVHPHPHPHPPPTGGLATGTAASGNFVNNGQRGAQFQPLSPLPPFPAVHTAAESPISAYMRFLHSSVSNFDSDPKRFSSPLLSPRWNNPTQSQPQPQLHLNHHQQSLPPPQPNMPPPPPPTSASSAPMVQPQFPMPSSPLGFGCLPSPRSPYPLLSPNMLLSPTTAGQLGFHQFPVSPRMPVPGPGWKDL